MAEKKYLEKDQVPYLLTKIKGKIPTTTSSLTNDSGFITSADLPDGAAASTTTPKMDGTVSVGTETAFARGDHVHPSDSSKVDKVDGKGLSTNDFTTDYKNKLDGIAVGANKTTVDSTLSSSSTNPVQNKVINNALNSKVSGVKITGDDTSNPGTNVSFLAPKDSSGNLLLQAGAGLSIQNLANDAGVRFNVECGEWIDGSYAPASVSDAKNAVDTLATTISNTYAKKDDITKMMTYKGSVATFDTLPTNASVGDTYNVESDGMNYTWTGTAWDANGSTFTINSITNEEIDTMFTNW